MTDMLVYNTKGNGHFLIPDDDDDWCQSWEGVDLR